MEPRKLSKLGQYQPTPGMHAAFVSYTICAALCVLLIIVGQYTTSTGVECAVAGGVGAILFTGCAYVVIKDDHGWGLHEFWRRSVIGYHGIFWHQDNHIWFVAFPNDAPWKFGDYPATRDPLLDGEYYAHVTISGWNHFAKRSPSAYRGTVSRGRRDGFDVGIQPSWLHIHIAHRWDNELLVALADGETRVTCTLWEAFTMIEIINAPHATIPALPEAAITIPMIATSGIRERHGSPTSLAAAVALMTTCLRKSAQAITSNRARSEELRKQVERLDANDHFVEQLVRGVDGTDRFGSSLDGLRLRQCCLEHLILIHLRRGSERAKQFAQELIVVEANIARRAQRDTRRHGTRAKKPAAKSSAAR